jgi:hypothetical protein
VLIFVPLAAVMAMTQFPFAAPIYFLYVLPLILIAASAAMSLQPVRSQQLAGITAVLYIAFGLVQVIPGAPDSLAMSADHSPDLAWLEVPRARLLVPSDDAVLYRQLVVALDSLPPGPIWAGPDAPEVAFLSGRVDLNRAFFAFLTSDLPPSEALAGELAGRGAQAIVVDTAPSFSAVFTPAALDSVAKYFPRVQTVDRFRIHTRGRMP